MSWLSKTIKKASKAVKKTSIKKIAKTVEKTAKDVGKAASSPVGTAILGIAGTVITGGLLGPIAATVAARAAGMAAKLGKVTEAIQTPLKGMPGTVNNIADKLAGKISKNSGSAAEVMVWGGTREAVNPSLGKTIATPSKGGNGMLYGGLGLLAFLLLKGKK